MVKRRGLRQRSRSPIPSDDGHEQATDLQQPRLSRTAYRQRAFVLVAVLAVLLSGSGLIASTWVKSPAQRAAEHAAPPASTLTAIVQEKVLSSAVAVRGTVSADSTVAVAPKSAAPAGSILAVTGAPKKAGDSVAAGDVVAEISGRPVIALPGAIPAYRNLLPGTTGRDVAQLQEALKGLGFAVGDAAGTFGRGTQHAVEQLYASRGYAAETTTDLNGTAETDELTSARIAERAAQRTVRDATTTVEVASDAASAAAARQQLTDAKAALADASSKRAGVEAHIGVMVPFGEVVYVPTMPAAVGSIGATVGAVLSGSDSAVLTLLTGQLGVRALLAEGQQQLVSAGMGVTITDDLHSRTGQGTVVSVGPYTAARAAADGQNTSASSAQAESGYPLAIAMATALDPSWLGADVLVRVTTASTAGPVLVVPATALTTHADGSTSLLVLASDNTRRDVPVTTGALADGEVQVTPTVAHALQAGDTVVLAGTS